MIDVSVILPCYNSASAIRARVLEFEAILNRCRWSYEILLCDDGSQDNTAAICRDLCAGSETRRFLPSAINRGRGQNVIDGIRQSHGRMIGYADVDMSTSAGYIVPVLNALEDGYEVAQANRTYKLHLSHLPFIFHRFAAHRVYASLVRRMLGFAGHDTESGFKFFRREAILALLETTRSAGWFWDTEVIGNAHALGYRVAEIPSLFVRVPKMASTVRLFRDSVQQFRQLRSYALRQKGKSLRQRCCR